MKYLATLFVLLGLTVEIFAQSPTANFSADRTAGCSPIIVNFSDLSTGNPTSWKWDFGNGATSTRQHPSTTYINPGTYNVTLTVTNASGTNSVTKTSFIVVFTEPTAEFTSDKTTNCAPAVIQFLDQSVTPPGTNIVGWKWDFGDGGGTSTAKNPVYSYKLSGSYTVSLTITNDKGCTKVITKPNYIDATTGVVPNFSFTDPAVCRAPATVNFTNSSVGPGTLSYSWDFGNGNTSTARDPSNIYSVNGKYRVGLTVTSSQGCVDSLFSFVDIGKVNTDFILNGPACPKAVTSFLNNSTPRPIRSLWKFPGGQTDTLRNGQAVFATAGNHQVTLINTYQACTDTLVKTISVMNAPTIVFKASDSTKCKPSLTVNFSNTTNGVSYLWDFGDSTTSTAANPSHTYSNYGSYDVRLIATGSTGCSDTLTKSDYIKIKKPVITFPDLPLKGCAPFNVTLKANIESADSVTSYLWNFGDTTATSTLRSPSHTYVNPGNHNVTLTITTAGGCTETFTKTDGVLTGLKPTAAFSSTSTNACASPGIQFINQSTGATSYIWTFSDSTTSTLRDPLHSFNDTGWISVKLKAINNGCEHEISKTNYAYLRPSVSKFDYKPDCSNRLRYTFTDKSIGATSWLWDFGDGTTFNGQNPPAHVFPAASTYNISLTTTNGSCSYTLTRTISIADYTPTFTSQNTQGCKPHMPFFSASVPNPDLIKKYIWDFGDSTALDSNQNWNAQHTYLKSGQFSVTLNTIDSFGCSHSITKNQYITISGPEADFTSAASSGCKGMTVTFNDSTVSDGRNPIQKWKWDFGDGTIQTYTAPPFQHRYDSVGDYDVKLVVTDAAGCSDSVTYRAFVKISTLKPDFYIEGPSCPGSPVILKNKTVSDLPYSSLWHLGDGQTSTLQDVAHSYADTGHYRVMLIVQDIVGCTDSIAYDSIAHIARPKADFTANNLVSYCTPFEARFTNTSYFAVNFNWDLKVATSTQQHPSVYYTNTGEYEVKLVVTSWGGCKDSIQKKVNVYSANDARLTYSPLDGCTPRTVNFDAFTSMNADFIWDFGDGNVTDTTTNVVSHVYTDYGNFLPTVILKEPSKTCVIALQGSDTIRMLGVKPGFIIDTAFFCDSGTITIQDTTTTNDPAIAYRWDFGDGGFSTEQHPTHSYTAPGLYTVGVTYTTQRGCIDSLKKGPVKIVSTPRINIDPDSVICVNTKVNYSGILSNTDTSVLVWNWRFPNGNTSNLQNPPAQVYTNPGAFAVNVEVTNSSGCKDSVTKSLLIHALPTIQLPGSLTKFVGVPLTLPAVYSSGIVNYAWSPAATLDCNNCPQPVTTTKFNTKYTVVATDSNGCAAQKDIQVVVLCQGAKVFVPNTFSPNGDGNNEIFYLRGTGLDRVKSMRIFNRWGEVVFEQRDFPSDNPMYGWNGKHKGSSAPPGVYVYQMEVFCENGEVIRFEGNISLIQ